MPTQLSARTGGVRRLLSGGVAQTSPPGPPSIVAIVAGNGQVVVKWARPTSSGGSPLTGYGVTLSTGQTASTNASTFSVTLSATNGTPVTATVTATNGVGSSTSTPSAPVTPRLEAAVKPSRSITGIPVGAPGDSLRDPLPGGLAGLSPVGGAGNPPMSGIGATEGVTYDGMIFYCGVSTASPTSTRLRVTAPNVTFTRCRFVPLVADTTAVLQMVSVLAPGAKFLDCEFDGLGQSGQDVAPYPSGFGPSSIDGTQHSFEARRCYFRGCKDSLRVVAGTTFLNNFVDGGMSYFDGAGQSRLTHSDCIQGTTTAAVALGPAHIANNYLRMESQVPFTASNSRGFNAALQLGGWGAGTTMTGWVIEGNWFDGGGYTISGTLTNVTLQGTNVIRDNKFGLQCGYGAVHPAIRASAMWGTGNVWEIDGTTDAGKFVLAGQEV